MNRMMWQKLYLGMAVLLLCSNDAFAQSFGDAYLDSAVSASSTPTTSKKTSSPANITTGDEVEQNVVEEKKLLQEEQKRNAVFVPGGGMDQLKQPTFDKSVRGGSFAVEVNDKGETRSVDNIFLYYENFHIYSSLNNMAACDMRFYILSNLDRKITNIDVKLVWPQMTTGISFSDVMPNTPTYVNYSLLGEGCYTMDKVPNIVVKRCRVKGMSASDCASKILWLNVSSRK